MARSISFRILIAYETFETFAAVIRQNESSVLANALATDDELPTRWQRADGEKEDESLHGCFPIIPNK